MAKKIKISLIILTLLAAMLAIAFSAISTGETAHSATYNYSSANFNIDSQSDFESFILFVKGLPSSSNNFAGKNIYLNCNVDLAGNSSFLPYLFGNFYGNNYSISNAISAVFGSEIGTSGKVYDLIINKINTTVSESAVAVINNGLVQNVKVNGSITYSKIGGLVYNNYGSIVNCINAANLNISGKLDSQGVGGIAFNNYGTISNSHFLGNITVNNTVKALGSLVAYNTEGSGYPVIEKSSATTEIYINTTGDPVKDSILPEKCGTLIGKNQGKLYNSYFIGYYISYLTLPISIIGDDTTNTAPSPYENVYMMTQGTKIVYDSATSSFIQPVGTISSYINFASYPQVYASEINSYPILKLFEGAGTALNPFLIKNVFHLYALRGLYNTEAVSYEAVFTDDIDCRNYTLAISLNGFTYTSIVDGQGFAIKNYAHSTIFTQNQALILFNLGFYNSPNVSIAGTLFNEQSAYNYGFGGTTNNISAATPSQGTGTELDPYIIKTKEELKYISGSSAYYKMGNSIVLNSVRTASYANYLNITEFRGNFDGNGYIIVGLFENFISINEGTVKNLTVKGYADSGTMSFVCSTNNGNIQNVTVYSSLYSNVTTFASVAQANNGVIDKALSIGNDMSSSADIGGIAITNNGTISNCFVAMENDAVFALNNDYGTINTSIGKDSNYIAVNNNSNVNMEYFALVASGFDVNGIFGYEINTSNAYPTLRQKCVRYKTSSDFMYNKTRTFIYTYSDTKTYTKSQFYNSIVTSMINFTAAWTYNGSTFNDANLSNAGTYILTLTYAGDNLYLPSKYSQTITINKQTQTSSLTFEEGAFDNITTTYIGADIEITESVPNNLTECGYVYSYTLKQGENVVTQVRNANVYTQTIIGVSTNYTNVTATRTITVNKAPLQIYVGNLSIDYLQNAEINSATLTLSGLIGSDENLTISSLVKQGTTPSFSTNYTQGSDVGEYYINYSAELTNYTVTNTVPGTLTVNKINLPKGAMVFNDQTWSYLGYYINFAVSNLPQGATVSYDNNQYKDAGDHLVTATVSKANYNDLILTATLSILKKGITFKADAVSINYDKDRTQIAVEQFSYTVDGAVGLDIDNISTIVSPLVFNYAVKKDGVAISEFNAGIYDIELQVTGTLQNYVISTQNSTLEINPIAMTDLYPSHDNYNATYNGEEKTHPITFFDTYLSTVNYEYYKDANLVDSCVNAGVYTVNATVTKINDNYIDTLYTYTITIAKADINIYFEEVSYTVTYDKTNKASAENYPYLGTLPIGLNATFIIKNLQVVVNEAVNASTYSLIYEVAESENYKAKSISTSLIISPKAIAIIMQSSYTYSSNNIEPFLTNITGAISGEVTGASFTFAYFNSEMVPQTRITQVGSYIIRATVTNPNYYLPITDYSIVVNKLTVSVDLKYLEYSYGFKGNLTYGGINYAIYSGGIITRKAYFVAATNSSVDISYQIARDDAGTYTVNELNSGTNYTFVISPDSSLNNNNKIKITPVTLLTIWKFGTTEISGMTKNLTYSGIDLFGYFGYNISGFVNNHKQSDFSFEIRENNSKTLKDVGQYTLSLSLLSESNYIMDNKPLQVTIEKALLNVKMLNVNVFRGEPLSKIQYEIINAVGTDATIIDIYALKGANLNISSTYTVQSTIGSIHDYYFTGTFTNYSLNITQVGKVTVVVNPKIEFTFNDKSFIYDGTYKSLRVEQSEEVVAGADVVLVYSGNNSQREVGTYQITLTVTYNIDSSVKTYTKIMSITPAYPDLVMENTKTVYRDNFTLEPKHIKGKAYINGNEVAGTFVFAESYLLEKGIKQGGYQVRFIPADSYNLRVQTTSYSIEGVVLNANVFSYDDLSKITYTEKGIAITGRVTMTINNALIDGLTLYRNNSLVDSIVLDKSQNILIGIKYEDETVYEQEMQVVLIEPTENVEIIADERCLDLVDGLTLNNKTLLVGSLGGRIALSGEYSEKYLLFVNGVKITDGYPINGNEESIVVVIKDAKTLVTLYAEEYEVKQDEKAATEAEVKKYTVLIVVASVFGGAGIIVGLYFLIKKIISDKKIGFNPYNRK